MAKKPKGKPSGKPGRPRGRPPKAKAAAGAAGPSPAPNKAQVARKVISEGKLTGLMRTCASLTQQGASLNGALREKIAYAVEHDYLDKQVFALIRRLDKMEPERLAIFLDNLEHYIDISGLGDRADSVQNLPLAGGGKGPAKDKTAAPARKAAKTNGNASDGNDTDEPAGDPPEPIDDGKVSRPQFGQAPGGTVTMLPDAAGIKH